MLHQFVRFFRGTAEHGRVTPLQANHVLSSGRQSYKFCIDLVLSPNASLAVFAQTDLFRVVGRVRQNQRIDQVVIQDHVCSTQTLDATQGYQARCAGTSANQVDFSGTSQGILPEGLLNQAFQPIGQAGCLSARRKAGFQALGPGILPVPILTIRLGELN